MLEAPYRESVLQYFNHDERKILRRRNFFRKRRVKIQVSVIESLQHSLIHYPIQIRQVDYHSGFGIHRPAYEHFDHIVVAVPMRIVALSVCCPVFAHRQRIHVQPMACAERVTAAEKGLCGFGIRVAHCPRLSFTPGTKDCPRGPRYSAKISGVSYIRTLLNCAPAACLIAGSNRFQATMAIFSVVGIILLRPELFHLKVQMPVIEGSEYFALHYVLQPFQIDYKPRYRVGFACKGYFESIVVPVPVAVSTPAKHRFILLGRPGLVPVVMRS